MEEEKKESEESRKDSEDAVVEGEERQSEAVEAADSQEAMSGLPEDTSSHSDGKRQDIWFLMSVSNCHQVFYPAPYVPIIYHSVTS